MAQANTAEQDVQVYRQAQPAIVTVRVGNATGSGSIISPDGLILTAGHIAAGGQSITVTLPNGSELPADLVGFSQGHNLAALKLRDQTDLPALKLASSVSVGEPIYLIHSPFGFADTLSSGIISRIDENQGLIQFSAENLVTGEDAGGGGPLLNRHGELIGVFVSTFVNRSSGEAIGQIGFATSLAEINSFLADVQAGRTSRTAPARSEARSARMISIGEAIDGELTQSSPVLKYDNSYYDAYKLEGQAGQQIAIDMTSQSFDAYLILLGPDGAELAQDDDSGGGSQARLQISLPTSGSYTVMANSYGAGAVGRYRIQVSLTEPEPER